MQQNKTGKILPVLSLLSITALTQMKTISSCPVDNQLVKRNNKGYGKCLYVLTLMLQLCYCIYVEAYDPLPEVINAW